MTDHLPEHSPLGASSMDRWSNCPGSIRESKGIEGNTSIYAAEGTVAHEIAAECLEDGSINPYRYVGEVWNQDGFDIEITNEMIEAVTEYLVEVRSSYSSVAERPIQKVEHKFHLEKIHPMLFGTSDCVQYFKEERRLRVYDYKHGSGKVVEVKGNNQLRYYALGCLLSFAPDALTIEIVIVQPRAPHTEGVIREERLDVIDLMDWIADLLDAVKRTEDPSAPLVAGDWCGFCRAAPTCPKLQQKAQELAKLEFGGDLYEPMDLAQALEYVPTLEAWCKNVRAFAYAEATRGRVPPGFKLVDKRGTRKWRDEVDAEQKLSAIIDESTLFKKKLLSPNQVETELKINGFKPKQIKEMLSDYVALVSSGTTLVPDGDNRAEVKKGAAIEFQDAEIVSNEPTVNIFA